MPARFANRDEVAAALRARAESRPASTMRRRWTDIPRSRASPPSSGEIPAAQAWAAEELSLPMHPDLSEDEVEYVAEAVIEAVITTARAGGARC